MKYLILYENWKKPKPKYKVGDYIKINLEEWPNWYKYPIGRIVSVSHMGLEYQYEPVYSLILRLNDGNIIELQSREEYIERKATPEEIEIYKMDDNIKKYNL